MVERKRRERIDKCLDSLKTIVVNNNNNNNKNMNKTTNSNNNNNNNSQSRTGLEKADILELTLEYLLRMQDEHPSQRSKGYDACLEEVKRFSSTGSQVDKAGDKNVCGSGGYYLRNDKNQVNTCLEGLIIHLQKRREFVCSSLENIERLSPVVQPTTGSDDKRRLAADDADFKDRKSVLHCYENLDDFDDDNDNDDNHHRRRRLHHHHHHHEFDKVKRLKLSRSSSFITASSSSSSSSSSLSSLSRSPLLEPASSVCPLSSSLPALPMTGISSPLAGRVAPSYGSPPMERRSQWTEQTTPNLDVPIIDCDTFALDINNNNNIINTNNNNTSNTNFCEKNNIHWTNDSFLSFNSSHFVNPRSSSTQDFDHRHFVDDARLLKDTFLYKTTFWRPW